MSGLNIRARRLLRPLIGIVTAYALAAQSLLIVLGGFALPAQANDGAPAFELCLHDGQDVPTAPAKVPDQGGCNHCIFCFAGAHQAAVAAPAALLARVPLRVTEATWIAANHPFPPLTPHTIANPRGPPPRA